MDTLFYIFEKCTQVLIILFVLLIGCTSTNKKMETHPTNNENALEALDKFWELLRPLRILNGVSTVN